MVLVRGHGIATAGKEDAAAYSFHMHDHGLSMQIKSDNHIASVKHDMTWSKIFFDQFVILFAFLLGWLWASWCVGEFSNFPLVCIAVLQLVFNVPGMRVQIAMVLKRLKYVTASVHPISEPQPEEA